MLPPPWQLCRVVMTALLAAEEVPLLSSSISSAVTTSEKEQGQDYRAARSSSLWKGLWRDEVITKFFFWRRSSLACFLGEKKGRAFPCSTQVSEDTRLCIAPGLVLTQLCACTLASLEEGTKKQPKIVSSFCIFSAAIQRMNPPSHPFSLCPARTLPGPLQLIYLSSEKSRFGSKSSATHY